MLLSENIYYKDINKKISLCLPVRFQPVYKGFWIECWYAIPLNEPRPSNSYTTLSYGKQGLLLCWYH